MKTFKIERRLVEVKKGWFLKEYLPMWCLVEYGKHTITDNYGYAGIDTYEADYNKVILQSEDLEYIKQEFFNFSGDTIYECQDI